MIVKIDFRYRNIRILNEIIAIFKERNYTINGENPYIKTNDLKPIYLIIDDNKKNIKFIKNIDNNKEIFIINSSNDFDKFLEKYNVNPLNNCNIYVSDNQERDIILEILEKNLNINWEDGTPATHRKTNMFRKYYTIVNGKISQKEIIFNTVLDVYNLLGYIYDKKLYRKDKSIY